MLAVGIAVGLAPALPSESGLCLGPVGVRILKLNGVVVQLAENAAPDRLMDLEPEDDRSDFVLYEIVSVLVIFARWSRTQP